MDQPFPPPMKLSEPTPDLMSEDQRRRALTLAMAKPLLTASSAFAGRTPPDVSDLIALADWIITGTQGDLYPYADHEGIVHLGPNITMRPEGYLYVNGDLYVPQSDPDEPM